MTDYGFTPGPLQGGVIRLLADGVSRGQKGGLHD